MTAATATQPQLDWQLDDLSFPETIGSFIAYEATPRRVPDAQTGTTLEARSEVFVRQYRGVLVKSVETKSMPQRDGELFETLSVKFDAASAGVAGFRKDFTANCLADSKVGQLLQWAHTERQKVAVAIETRRRYKVKGTSDVISPLAGIQWLRSDSDGKPNANRTGDHCINILAAAGVENESGQIRTWVSGETASDVNEWADLRSNRDGDLPPRGWRHITDSADPSVSAIAPVLTAVPTPGPQTGGQAAATDGASLAADQVAALVRQALSRMGIPTGGPDEPQVRDVPAGVRPGARSVEAKPWEPRNSDGRVNPSSYLLSKWRGTFDFACELVGEAMSDPSAPQVPGGQVIPVTRTLTTVLLWAADQVQARAVGHTNRAAASHHEAAMWVKVVVGRFQPYPSAALVDQGQGRSWAKSVVDLAAESYRWSLSEAAGLLGVDADLPPAGE